ncbi:DUF1566 domain-containing protein [Methylibium sp.]|uniref:Lcl C-terminal domain-containing protein n=1 Tax=Methylibium sp. TaxID=2067992 RepID=UPI003D0B7FFF
MKPPWTACRWLVGSLAAALATAAAWAAEPPASPNWLLSEDGAYVIDPRSKLAWPRCVEGMQWNGKTCTGEPVLVNHAEAMALATTRAKADGVRWRLPRVAELQRLVNKAAAPRRLDPVLFPAAPGTWHWAIRANVDTATVNQYDYGNIVQGRTNANANRMAFLHGWAVNLETGEARGDVTKRTKLPVRLVRPQP